MGRRKLTKILLESGCNPTIKNKQGETAMDIALRKEFKEIQEVIANPPPSRQRSASVGGRPELKKREKAASLGSDSRTTDSVEKLKKKAKWHGSSKSVRFLGSSQHDLNRSIANATPLIHNPAGPTSATTQQTTTKAQQHPPPPAQEKPPLHSPYGCPQAPDMADFPTPKLNSLPSDPLRKGEQYFVDLAGNIKKGPVNKAGKCSCQPSLSKLEKRLDNDKKEIKHHIDCRHQELNTKIHSLEKKTSKELVTLNETVKEKLADERAECIKRTQRLSLLEKLDFERQQRVQVEQLRGDMRMWLRTKLEAQSQTQLLHNHNHNHLQQQHQQQLHNNHHQQITKAEVTNYATIADTLPDNYVSLSLHI